MISRLALCGAVLSLLAGPAEAAMLQVVVAGVRNNKGEVHVALCSERNFLKEDCEYTGHVRAAVGEVMVVLEVPPGIYAVQAYHDEDMNGRVTMNMLGLPTEGLAFSNDAPFRFHAPRWEDARFQVTPMGGRIRMTLKYLF
jgi:uncharacterized protein (DUF2141 family)